MIPFYIETYGCQMNVSDSQVVARILSDNGYEPCNCWEDARIVLINTCSIRENAEKRVMSRLDFFARAKRKDPQLKVGVLGCMATRLMNSLLNHPAVDCVAGPDSYRLLPGMLEAPDPKSYTLLPGMSLKPPALPVNVELSVSETYAEIRPLRETNPGVTSFVTIMRGCNNMCAYCVVPYVRGRERSRDPYSILEEVRSLVKTGYREVTLLGQNVDSYLWQPQNGSETVSFARLLEQVALVSPLMRVRFTTSHPKDMQDDVLLTMARYPNICKHIHLPVQSGSDKVLQKMNRKYTRESYLERIARIREILPGCAISSDMIAGFCSETEEDHALTLSLMEAVRYDQAFMFQYSQRPGTLAARHYPDDVPEEVKTRRLAEIIALQNRLSLQSNQADVGKVFEVLAEGISKRSSRAFFGRTTTNKVCVFPRENRAIGDYVRVLVKSCTAATLKGEIVNENQ
ncbi:MAG: tRNA (N6-isopentenyl adenosine(37)-C2)-methylthiotransferase MiaB [Bacteroidales bacterium]|jgi:tRNA-2-methylthio-N6-dimethylallyladenosine synthase|nr:tRNA (N6-isopentenyl adenosine(37)-C2)-methylthiotransferase MiaB [Bacteroidales bacterium]